MLTYSDMAQIIADTRMDL